MFTPDLARKSALPDLEVMDLLPCLTTFPPHDATTNAEMVEQLNIFRLEPPVPQVSINSLLGSSISSTYEFITDANASRT